MHKKLVALLITTFFACNCYAAGVWDNKVIDTPLNSNKSTSLVVSGNADFYTLSFPVGYSDSVGVMYQCQTASCDLKIQLQQSFAKSGSEGTTDTAYLTTNTITSQVNDTIWHMATIDTVIMPWARFYIKGQNSNPGGTTIILKVSR